MVVTLKQLRQFGACEGQVKLFKELFGECAEITEENIRKYGVQFDMEWIAPKIMSATQYADYDSKLAALDADCESKLSPLYADYESKRAALYADYDSKRAALYADYDSKRAALYAEYEIKRAPLYADYVSKRALIFWDALK